MEGEFVLHKRQIPNIEEEIKRIIELSDVGRGWIHVNTTENVNCYSQKSDRSPFDYILGEAIVHTTTDILLQFLQNPNTTTEIDPTLIEREEIVKLSESSRVMRLRYKFPALLSNREFVVHAYDGVVSEDPKMVVCASISVTHEMCPEDPQYVRGIILTSGYVCKEITQNPPRTHVAYVAQFDPKGWIPAVVINIISSEQARNVLRLKKYFERAFVAEQTYKFPSQLLRTIDDAQNGEGSEAGAANGSDSSQSCPIEWREEDAKELDRGSVRILDLLDTEQDREAKETLLDPSTTPVTAAKLLQNLFS